ncbi:MAG: DNA repair protein RecO [Oscillospiraceae bacterium]|nr:DNA repair protein RecO [Oscillospiraceae bacterium]
MYLTTRGLVLRITNYSDTDALLTILTHTHGKLTVKARGLRRKNSPLVASCQLLAYSEFTLFEYRGKYTINEANTIDLFSNLQRDLQKLALGTYFSQVAEVLCQEDIPNPELLSLLLNCLYALSVLDTPERTVKAVFELRASCIAGYTPDLQGCYRCGEPFPDTLNISTGQLECNRCPNPESTGIRMPVTSGALDTMRYICACNPKQLFAFSTGEDTISCVSDISECYLATQLERGFSALDFYKSLIL